MSYQSDLERFAVLNVRKRELNEELARLAEEHDKLETTLLDQFADLGQQSVRVSVTKREPTDMICPTCGERRYVDIPRTITISLRTQLYAGIAKDENGNPKRAEMVEAMERAGLVSLLSVNHNTLSSWARELPKNEVGEVQFPDGLADVLEASYRTGLTTRIGAAK